MPTTWSRRPTALYRAKALGRNRVEIAEESGAAAATATPMAAAAAG